MNATDVDGGEAGAFTEMVLSVGQWGSGVNVTLVEDVRVPVNATGVEVPFDLKAAWEAAQEGGNVFQAVGKSADGAQRFEAKVEVTWLPERSDGGSMARMDKLNGGIHVSSRLTEGTWKSLYPVGFYTRWDWISWLIDPDNEPIPPNLASNETKSLKEYKERGYNLIHAVPPGGWESFDSALLEKFLTVCDELELYVMYDMRHTYLNLSSISWQLPRLQTHPSLLLYYTGDEPDGWTDPLNGTILAYNRIYEIDPYHPTSLVLNCYNFYFEEYTSGADIILEDTYPLIISSTFSPVYNTVCNRTYGDCGCDFCHVNDTAYPDFTSKPFQDVVERVDNFYTFQKWLGHPATKPVWGVPQWFFDANSFWSRWATADEAIVMGLLRVTHGAMGVTGWLFPTSPEVESATTEMARVLTREDVSTLLVDGPGLRLDTSVGNGTELDVAAWVGESEMLVIVVWARYVSGNGASIVLPTGGRNISGVDTLLGAVWEVRGDSIWREKTTPLEYSVLKAKLGV